MDKSLLTTKIKSRAYELGFDKIGIARSEKLDNTFLESWIEAGYHGSMQWMERTAETRTEPEKYLPGVKSVIVGAVNYYTEDSPRRPGTGQISRYAVGRDYHLVLREMLGELRDYLHDLHPHAKNICAVDDAPVADKIWAAKAGIGWIGKHSNVLSRDIGSYFFIGEILTTADLDYDEPVLDHCGTCTLCLDACPTNAILDNCVVDSNRCISYRTIEYRGNYPDEWNGRNEDWLFGCDVCQEVCPWNKFAQPTNIPDFSPRENVRFPLLDDIKHLSKEAFQKKFVDSPVKRSKWEGLKRNASQTRMRPRIKDENKINKNISYLIE
jgi:epoxyqueuosine reductase